MDRVLNFKQHLEEVAVKVTYIRRLACTTWGASAKTLRISTQALVFSAAEYCAPVWSRSPRILTSPSTALYGPYLVVSSRHLCFSSLSWHVLLQRGGRSGTYPDPPKYIAMYQTQEKASRQKTLR